MSRERTLLLRITTGLTGCACMLTAAGGNAGTVISEVLYDAAGADSGSVFVELYGAPGTVLDGLLLEGVNGADGSVYRTVPLVGNIPSGGVFVIADDAGGGSTLVADADLVADVDFQNGPDSIVLRDGDVVLDAVGYGDFTSAVFAGEGEAVTTAPAGSSIARLDPRMDSGNNLADFMVLDVPTPGAVAASAVPVPAPLGLLLSGLAGLGVVARRKEKART